MAANAALDLVIFDESRWTTSMNIVKCTKPGSSWPALVSELQVFAGTRRGQIGFGPLLPVLCKSFRQDFRGARGSDHSCTGHVDGIPKNGRVHKQSSLYCRTK